MNVAPMLLKFSCCSLQQVTGRRKGFGLVCTPAHQISLHEVRMGEAHRSRGVKKRTAAWLAPGLLLLKEGKPRKPWFPGGGIPKGETTPFGQQAL
jgi:hypothetical protein